MKRNYEIPKWFFHNFFTITLGVFLIIYMRWFRLTPLVFDGSYNDPNSAYIAGLILFGLSALFTTITWLTRSHHLLRIIPGFLTIVLFCLNFIHIYFFLPGLTASARCNGKSFYLTDNSGTLFDFWSYHQFTIWESPFAYKSMFFGYGGWREYQIVCDKGQDEVNVIAPAIEALVYTYGENSRTYLSSSTTLKEQRYFVAEEWVVFEDCNEGEHYWECEEYVYTLYTCNLEYKSCHPLPVRFLSDFYIFGYLEADEGTNEVHFYDNDDDSLIFAYGDHPRCYVEGCEILNEE